MMKINVVEDTFTPWLNTINDTVRAELEQIIRFAMRNFYEEVLIHEVPVADDDYVTGYKGGSLLESGSEPFWTVIGSGEHIGIEIEFSGSNNPPENREKGNWIDWLPNKPYGWYQHEKGVQNTHWLSEPLAEHEKSIITDMEKEYWSILSKGGK